MPKRLKDIDSAERSLLIQLGWRIGGPVLLLLVFAEYAFFPQMVAVLLVPDLLFTALVVWLVYRTISLASGVANSLLMPSGTPPVRGYSEQDALVARRLFTEAADSYRTLIVAYPEDLDARLRLAALLTRDLDGAAAAERCFLEVRRSSPSPQQAWIIGNGLIDLYRASGQREKLKAELGRLALDHGGSEAGSHAQRYLAELEREDHDG